MNPIGEKFISLFLVFSLLVISVNLYAKERRGAELIITKKNGYQTEGELITVKPNSLLLLNTEGKDVSVDIEEIKVIRVVKKSKALSGSLVGFLIPAIITGLLFLLATEIEESEGVGFLLPLGLVGSCAGALIGGISGAIEGIDKIIQFEGMTDSKIQETLDYLRKRARVRDYR